MARTRRLEGQVVVITGASSGIGRCAAAAFAREGAAVVLAARRGQALHQAAEDVLHAGGRAMVVETDVRDEAQVQRLAERAVDAFGGIEVWINNAGVGHFSRFEETPPDVFAEVVNTTFFGTVHGTRAVLPHFRERGQGVIINNVSIAGRVPAPFHTAYASAKHAVLGFADTLRLELRDTPGIQVCNVLPGPIDTPFWQHAANFSGREVKALQPAHPPEEVAETMVRLALHPQREVGVNAPVRIAELARAVAPGMVDRMWGRMTESQLFRNRPHERTRGAVVRPMPEGREVHGGWGGPQGSSIPWTGLLALAVPIGAAVYYGTRSGGHQPQRQDAGMRGAGMQADMHAGMRVEAQGSRQSVRGRADLHDDRPEMAGRYTRRRTDQFYEVY
ncbi:MAG TPA: SDR family oxidoreductase [Azospirillaceae bacterium]|nr:SDR family oxidoreductase [Azospirillaceae bacterium]